MKLQAEFVDLGRVFRADTPNLCEDRQHLRAALAKQVPRRRRRSAALDML